MFASSFATSYMMDPLLDMVGLRGGANFVYFGKAIKFWRDCTGGIHFAITAVPEFPSVFNVPECLGKFGFKSGDGSLVMKL